MRYKIISDSSCDLNSDYIKGDNIGFSVAPLTIHVNQEEFVDNFDLDIKKMLDAMHGYKEKSTSSCPSPDSFHKALEGADKYFIITISSKLSGSYNAASVARGMYKNPNDVFVIDSKTTSGAMVLIIDKLVQLIKEDVPYEDICLKIEHYIDDELGLLFVLNKFDNLVKNGRVSKIKAAIASTLSIKPICEADDGEIKFGKKVLGLKNAMKILLNTIGEKVKDFSKKSCVITYCQNLEVAETLKKEITDKYAFKSVRLFPMRGLTSFYALEGGLIVSFEK